MNLEKILNVLEEHGFRFFAAAVTGVLTYYAGLSLTQNPMYGITLVLLCEGMSLYWPVRLEGAQEVGKYPSYNFSGLVQWSTAIMGIVLAWGSIIVTDLASAVFIANAADIEVFSAFASVPEWAQSVVVYVLPVLAFTHGVLLTAFYIASPEAEQARQLRKMRAETRHSVARANADAEKSKAAAYAEQYKRVAVEAAKARGRAEADEQVTKRYAPISGVMAAETEAVKMPETKNPPMRE
jgi:membrane protein implicated in regulation of membrane protease activity